jgi:hypothetical protein
MAPLTYVSSPNCSPWSAYCVKYARLTVRGMQFSTQFLGTHHHPSAVRFHWRWGRMTVSLYIPMWLLADFSGWFRVKEKSSKIFDINVSTKHIYIKFLFGGCSPALPTLGCASAQHAQFSVFQIGHGQGCVHYTTKCPAMPVSRTNLSCQLIVSGRHIIIRRKSASVPGYLPDVSICPAVKDAITQLQPTTDSMT